MVKSNVLHFSSRMRYLLCFAVVSVDKHLFSLKRLFYIQLDFRTEVESTWVMWQKTSELKYTSRVLVRPGRLELRLPVNLTADDLAQYRPITATVSTFSNRHHKYDATTKQYECEGLRYDTSLLNALYQFPTVSYDFRVNSISYARSREFVPARM